MTTPIEPPRARTDRPRHSPPARAHGRVSSAHSGPRGPWRAPAGCPFMPIECITFQIRMYK
ncbi:hypothetical protein BDW75DRAFT_225197 [Aspergillus navahoensis]